MNRKYSGMKDLGRVSTRRNPLFPHRLHGQCLLQPKEKLPPRLKLRGISLAARVVSHEIRDFTKKKTGKDLVELKNSKLRNETIRKLSQLKLAICDLAVNHSTNFTKALSPDEPMVDYGFARKNPSSLVARYHEQYKRDHQTMYHEQCRRTETISARNSTLSKYGNVRKPDLPKRKLCGCYESVTTQNEGCCFVSCWQHKGINEEDMNTFLKENVPYFQKPGTIPETQYKSESGEEEWAEFMKNNKYTVFRKPLPSGIFEYRIQATFHDISANHLFKTQLDTEYRKKWDSYVINLDVVDSNPETSSELVHWITKCPYPFAEREYVFLRRYKVDHKNKAMILFQQATDKTNIPKDPKIMRVDTYLSKVIIKPHSNDFDQDGCDYLLSYYDDPRMKLPTRVFDMASSRGISSSMVRMHKAALDLSSE